MAAKKIAVLNTSNNTTNMQFVPLPLHKLHIWSGPLVEIFARSIQEKIKAR
jgi:hypothetical protein